MLVAGHVVLLNKCNNEFNPYRPRQYRRGFLLHPVSGYKSWRQLKEKNKRTLCNKILIESKDNEK